VPRAGCVVDTNLAAVNLIPCDMRMLKANRMILMDNGPRQYHLRDALKDVSANYDYCIMDCPPDLDMGSINALCAADWVIIRWTVMSGPVTGCGKSSTRSSRCR
jgi:chromosome partitioning protein